MRILVDVGHPAHVHFFRHPIAEWRRRGHQVRITARDKDVALALLDAYGLEHRVLSRVGRGPAGLVFELIVRIHRLRREMRRFGASVATAIGGGFIAPAARLAGVPSVVFTDTEHVASDRFLTDPLATVVCTPESFRRDAGPRQLWYPGRHELAYLHPDRFVRDPGALAAVGLTPGERYAVVRFVSWGAGHDIGHGGFSAPERRELVRRLGERLRVVLTSESGVPDDLRGATLAVPPERMLDVLAGADLYVGEGATMASEAALLGVPAVFVSTLAGTMGSLEELAEAGLLVSHPDGAAGIATALRLADDPEVGDVWRERRARFLAERIDVAAFVADVVERVAAGQPAAGPRS